MGTLVSIRGRSSGSSVMMRQNLQRHHRHGLLSAAYLDRNCGHHRDLARPCRCPLQAIVAAFGFDGGRSPRGGPVQSTGAAVHESLVEPT